MNVAKFSPGQPQLVHSKSTTDVFFLATKMWAGVNSQVLTQLDEVHFKAVSMLRSHLLVILMT
jgi:hypothetical protein